MSHRAEIDQGHIWILWPCRGPEAWIRYPWAVPWGIGVVELLVRRQDGREQTLPLPPVAVSVVETLLARLLSGERVAVLTEDQELSPTEASTILGISRPLVVHRMDIGDLPFRYAEDIIVNHRLLTTCRGL